MRRRAGDERGVASHGLQDTGYVDDPSPFARPHPGEKYRRQAPSHVELELHGLVPFGIPGIRRHRARAAGIIDQDIEPSEPIVDSSADSFRRRYLGEVGGDDQRLFAAFGGDLFSQRLQSIASPGGDGETSTFARHDAGDTDTDTGAGAGHEASFSVELQIHGSVVPMGGQLRP